MPDVFDTLLDRLRLRFRDQNTSKFFYELQYNYKKHINI
jgi:hypothetical protein